MTNARRTLLEHTLLRVDPLDVYVVDFDDRRPARLGPTDVWVVGPGHFEVAGTCFARLDEPSSTLDALLVVNVCSGDDVEAVEILIDAGWPVVHSSTFDPLRLVVLNQTFELDTRLPAFKTAEQTNVLLAALELMDDDETTRDSRHVFDRVGLTREFLSELAVTLRVVGLLKCNDNLWRMEAQTRSNVLLQLAPLLNELVSHDWREAEPSPSGKTGVRCSLCDRYSNAPIKTCFDPCDVRLKQQLERLRSPEVSCDVVRTCRFCQVTDDADDPTGPPFEWVEDDLCSACHEEAESERRR